MIFIFFLKDLSDWPGIERQIVPWQASIAPLTTDVCVFNMDSSRGFYHGTTQVDLVGKTLKEHVMKWGEREKDSILCFNFILNFFIQVLDGKKNLYLQ